jgi:beta-lactamase class D
MVMREKISLRAQQTVDPTMNMVRKLIVFIMFMVTACSPSAPQRTAIEEVKPELGKYFDGFNGAFVLYGLNGNRYVRYDPQRCAERLLPASTFKIINALIGLETGVIPDENYVIPWDGTQYENSTWNQDHTLKTAFQNSVVWYYQEVARRIGRERMQQYIDAVGYGNQDMTGNLDSFWLDGAIRISADEQVEFLKKLYQDDLPFSPRSIALVKEMMLVETNQVYELRGKTGSGRMDNVYVGWFVGYEEVNGNVYFFATNITSTDPETNGLKAKQILQEILKDTPFVEKGK